MDNDKLQGKQHLQGSESGAVTPGAQVDLESLKAVAARVQQALLPVEPSPDFVRDLRRRLCAMAEQRQPSKSFAGRRGLFIGAAVLGSVVSVAGIVAYVIYARTNAGAKSVVRG
ncbi:MAG: hypothetical protein H5T62_06290 [Anaerolineae bacterium]|nr:hypothetical protein [Anaerolineae bacterium]